MYLSSQGAGRDAARAAWLKPSKGRLQACASQPACSTAHTALPPRPAPLLSRYCMLTSWRRMPPSPQVTQHPECVLRITILDRQAGSDSSSSSSGSGSGSDVGCGTGDGGAATAGNTTAGATAATDSSSSSSSKSSSSSSSSSGASKFQVAALVVTHIHVVLVSSSAQGGLAAAVGRR